MFPFDCINCPYDRVGWLSSFSGIINYPASSSHFFFVFDHFCRAGGNRFELKLHILETSCELGVKCTSRHAEKMLHVFAAFNRFRLISETNSWINRQKWLPKIQVQWMISRINGGKNKSRRPIHIDKYEFIAVEMF